jgi:hypothetical protein
MHDEAHIKGYDDKCGAGFEIYDKWSFSILK